jgi:hypothetical protein
MITYHHTYHHNLLQQCILNTILVVNSKPSSICRVPTAMSGRRRVEADKRRRTESSCDVCKSRKQKCDKQRGDTHCRYCKAHDLGCATTQPRKQRVYGSLEHVGTRIRLLEAITKGLVPEADLSSNDELRRLGISLGIPLPPNYVANAPSSGPVATDGTPPIEKAPPLLPDQQGHVQYTGPASSFSFHTKLGSLFETRPANEFVMFGPNAAGAEAQQSPHTATSDVAVRLAASRNSAQQLGFDESSILPDPAMSKELIQAFFTHAHASLPVLHETSFRSTFEAWSCTKDDTNACWSVTLLCVFLLGSKVSHQQISVEQELAWWHQVQLRLPAVLFTTDMAALQALMLVALHLHHTSHRDACWNVLGVVVRIAHAIGLHSDEATAQLPPLTRELRKSIWWTLLAFEQLLVSSLDRPSAVDVFIFTVGPSDERVLGLMNPPEYSKWSASLVKLLGSACRARTSYGHTSCNEEALGPLSPALSALRDLQRWKELLPRFLQPEATQTTAPCYVRPILLLEVQYHYAVVVLTRSVLLEHATAVSKGFRQPNSEGLQTLSNECRISGTSLCRALIWMQESGCFDSVVGFDMFYGITGASILVLDMVIMMRETRDITEITNLLQKMATLSKKHLRNRKIPGTLRKWATLIFELYDMTNRFCAGQRRDSVRCIGEVAATQEEPAISDAQLLVGLQQVQTVQTSLAEQSSPDFSTSGLEQQHHNIDPSLWMDSTDIMNTEQSMPTSQQQWRWEDIEAILNS